MTEYRRYKVKGGHYFFTVNLANRRQRLLTENIDLLRQAFRKVKRKHPFTIDAIVIFPEHLHCVWTLPEHDMDFSLRWRQIKSEFSRQFESSEQLSVSRMNKQERGIWQRRFWEHHLRDEIDFNRHIDYIHFNPVKHGHVDAVKDWPYSSFHLYVKRGILPMDWADKGIEDLDLQ